MKYFDNASTTKISENSLNSYVSYSNNFYNPSALYAEAVDSKKLIEDAREFFIKYFKGDKNSTFIFTGCASESNNAVLNSCIIRKDKKYIISAGEHSSIHNAAKHYLELGYNVVFIPLASNGSIDYEVLEGELDSSVALVSVIHVSNETGAVNDIKKVVELVKKYSPNALIHSDGVQAVAKLDINLKELGVDFYTISAHKIHGPKGIGALYIKNTNKFKPFILGGGQENNLRAGTENIPAIKSFEVAVRELLKKDFSAHKKAFLDNLSGDYYLVSDVGCVDNIISICFAGVRGETIAHLLESKGYLIGTGSACNSGVKINRVISSIVPKKYAEGAIRISFDDYITIQDCIDLAHELSNAVENYKQILKR